MLDASRRKDAADAMGEHITHRLDETTGGIKEGISRIYLAAHAAE